MTTQPDTDDVDDTPPFPVTLRVDASRPIGELKPIWRFFGGDEPNYATMPNGVKLLGELGELMPNHVYFRTHNLLTTGDGTPALKWGSTNAYTEDAEGRPVYDWMIVDAIFDAGLTRGVKPYVQIGFMHEALSTNPQPYRHHWSPEDKYSTIYTGWTHPPTDYQKWAELIFQWVTHCVEKYGQAEVESWYWELWNEPNIGYWSGTPDEYFKLYDFTVDAVRRALPSARVGGPETAGGPGGDFLARFLEHCARGMNYTTGHVGSPLDFIAFHAKGMPEFLDGHVRTGIANELTDIDNAFAVVASFPEFKHLPIVIGEADPDGCAACQGPQLGYRNGALYPTYTAASFGRLQDLADRHGVNLEGALTWAFEFEGYPYFAGFRQLATNGVDMPILNVFRMFSKMSGQRLTVTGPPQSALEAVRSAGVRGKADVFAQAALDGDRLSILVWHYHDDDVPGPDAGVTVEVEGLPWPSGTETSPQPSPWKGEGAESVGTSPQSSASKGQGDGALVVAHYRIDGAHSNAYTAWQLMGSPSDPNATQLAEIDRASRLDLATDKPQVAVTKGGIRLNLQLPRQAVSLIVVSPA